MYNNLTISCTILLASFRKYFFGKIAKNRVVKKFHWKKDNRNEIIRNHHRSQKKMPFLVWFFITIQQTGTKVSSASSSSLLLLDLVIDDLCQLFGWCRIEKRPHVWMVVQYVNFHASKYIFFSIFDLWLIFRQIWWNPMQFDVCTFSCIFGPDSLPGIDESSEWFGRILVDGNVHKGILPQ